MLPKSTLFTILVIVVTLSCNKESKLKVNEPQTEDLDSLMLSLDTQEKKEQFLIDLYDEDQDVRNSDREHEILKRNNYDMNSYEYQEHMDRMIYVDSINFIKAKKYLETHGYPTFKLDDYRISGAIELICMHQPTYEKQLELFPYLYQAYKDNLITADNFSFLLNNMHRHKFDKSHPHAISNEENIKQLLEILELGEFESQ
ncbi:hypothetical protein [Aquimarina sp. AU58]|uniref:hypothetical protein n=1 Tax=Aquimarina sp. AU58 TaxID=1874112 RepID=UPI000D6470A1|nr:hypothetical protein [Aquimarina sp. AU58]